MASDLTGNSGCAGFQPNYFLRRYVPEACQRCPFHNSPDWRPKWIGEEVYLEMMEVEGLWIFGQEKWNPISKKCPF